METSSSASGAQYSQSPQLTQVRRTLQSPLFHLHQREHEEENDSSNTQFTLYVVISAGMCSLTSVFI